MGCEISTLAETLGLIPANSPRLAVHLGILTQPTCRAQIEILLVARATMDYVLPLFIRLDVLVLGRPSRKIPQKVRGRATMPFWVGVRGLHCLLVFTLHAVPLLFRGFALHLRQSLWHMPHRMQEVLPIFTGSCVSSIAKIASSASQDSGRVAAWRFRPTCSPDATS